MSCTQLHPSKTHACMPGKSSIVAGRMDTMPCANDRNDATTQASTSGRGRASEPTKNQGMDQAPATHRCNFSMFQRSKQSRKLDKNHEMRLILAANGKAIMTSHNFNGHIWKDYYIVWSFYFKSHFGGLLAWKVQEPWVATGGRWTWSRFLHLLQVKASKISKGLSFGLRKSEKHPRFTNVEMWPPESSKCALDPFAILLPSLGLLPLCISEETIGQAVTSQRGKTPGEILNEHVQIKTDNHKNKSVLGPSSKTCSF